MEGTMRAAIYYGIKDVRMEDRPIPQIGENDVLVKVLRAGICGSDTGAYLKGGEQYGVWSGFEFGHELVGKIVEKGAAVKDIEIDDIVFVNPMKAKRAGTLTADIVGAFSEYINVENAVVEENIYILDKNIDLDVAAIIEPVSVGTKGAVCLNPSVDDNVVVLGAGAIGLSAAAALIARGLKNVAVVDRDEFRLAKAVEIGCKTVNTSTDNLEEKLVEIFGQVQGHVFDPAVVDPKLLATIMDFAKKNGYSVGKKIPNVNLYVDAAGAPQLMSQCFSLGNQGTKYSVVSVFAGNVELAANAFVSNEPLMRGSRGYDKDIILEVIDHITKEKTNIKTMITKKFKHEDFVEAIESACNSAENIKVVIDYEM